jgi:hypothetical protein
MKELRGDRVHARVQLVRELFGLDDADEGGALQRPGTSMSRASSADAEHRAGTDLDEVAEVRELGQRRLRRPGA